MTWSRRSFVTRAPDDGLLADRPEQDVREDASGRLLAAPIR